MLRKFGLLSVLVISATVVLSTLGQDQGTTPNYFPLKIGKKWHYGVDFMNNGPKGQITNHITKTETIDGQETVVMESLVKGNVVATENIGINAKGLFRYRFNGSDATPPICLIRYPVKANDSWEQDIKITSPKKEENFKFICKTGSEEISVPAGKFKTLTVRIDTRQNDKNISSVYWFAADVGVVKQLVEIDGKKSAVLELEKAE